MTTGSLDGPTSTTNDLIIGDQIVGQISGALHSTSTRRLTPVLNTFT